MIIRHEYTMLLFFHFIVYTTKNKQNNDYYYADLEQNQQEHFWWYAKTGQAGNTLLCMCVWVGVVKVVACVLGEGVRKECSM